MTSASGLSSGSRVPRNDIEASVLAALPATGKIWVYIPVKADGELGVGLSGASAQFPLLESYIDVVVEGALEYGEPFARELLETTSDWSVYWLNDRELARRPWVYNPASSQVDELLMGTEEAAAKLKWRLFPGAIRSIGLRKRRNSRGLSPRPRRLSGSPLA